MKKERPARKWHLRSARNDCWLVSVPGHVGVCATVGRKDGGWRQRTFMLAGEQSMVGMIDLPVKPSLGRGATLSRAGEGERS